jgi:glucose-1-phosphate thymidylyltransferase
MNEKLGIILAGGSATRLRPVTSVVSKQLLPVYDKPVIYYPLTTLILAGYKRICLISTPKALPLYIELFGDGSKLGLEIIYVEQTTPNGLAAAFLLTEKEIGNSESALILGDNLFHGSSFGKHSISNREMIGAQIYAYAVDNPSEFGVVTFDETGKPLDLIEKPKVPVSNWAIPGYYQYDNSVIERAKELKPSARGELEITDLNRSYLDDGKLTIRKIQRGTAWLDLGTADGLLDASEYVRTLQKRQGVPIGSPEEAAWRMGLISINEFETLISECANPHYASLLSKAKETL